MSFTPALATRGHGTSAGVAVGARPWIGRMPIRLELNKLVGRVSATKYSGLLKGGFTLLSVYLTVGLTPQDALTEWAELAHIVRNLRGPWILCGYLQREPATLTEWGIPQCLGGIIKCLAQPTCFSPHRSSRIDAFIVATELEPMVQNVSCLPCAITRPHVPIILTLEDEKAVMLFGPDESRSWLQWAETAEQWLCMAHNIEPTAAWLGRGRGLTFRRTTVQHLASTRRPPRTTAAARAWRRLEHVCDVIVAAHRSPRTKWHQTYRWALRVTTSIADALNPLLLMNEWWTPHTITQALVNLLPEHTWALRKAISDRSQDEWTSSARAGMQAWHDWARQACLGGARQAHQWLRREVDNMEDPLCNGEPHADYTTQVPLASSGFGMSFGASTQLQPTPQCTCRPCLRLLLQRSASMLKHTRYTKQLGVTHGHPAIRGICLQT
eukprot:6455580-Amphidinium_carterae.4